MVGVACHFQLGAVPRANIEDLWEGISPGFRLVSYRQTLDLFDTCILWLVGIGSQRGERKWAYCRGL